MAKKKGEDLQIDRALLNVIAPMDIEVKRNELNIGDNCGRIFGITKYPQNVQYGWLGRVANISNVIGCISFRPIDSTAFVDALSANTMRNQMLEETAKSPLEQSRAKKAAEDSEKTMVQIDQYGETVGILSVALMPVGSEHNIESIIKRTTSSCAYMKLHLRSLANLQLEGFKQISPFYRINADVENVIGRIAPLSTIMGGFPFSASGFSDSDGYIIGKDSNGGLIILDPWVRGGDRTNSNFVITGIAGMGKSTAIKLIALCEWLRGTKIIFIDPEREYKDLCKNLGGDWINIGGGAGKINPLQIRPVPPDPEDEEEKLYKDEGHGMGEKALHMKTLEVFMSLYLPSLDDIKKALLKKEIIALYDSFGIHWDTNVDALKNEDYPSFADLAEQIKHSAAEAESYKKEYDTLALLLEDIAYGSDSFIWNGHSNIYATSRCVCLDTKDLQDAPDNIKRAQYFNALGWCWQQMSADRTEKVMLITDEGYLLADPQVPQSLIFLRNVEKRDRKYEAALIFATHSIVDMLDPSIKMYGQALLDIPCIKLLFGADGQNLQEIKALYNLTDAEEELLASKMRKTALLMVGAKRLKCVVEVSDKKLEIFGGAGGR